MMALKACPRCRGDLIQEEFLGEAELVCIQCGYRTDSKPIRLALMTRTSGQAA